MACTTITLPQVIASGTTPGTSAAPGFQYGRAGDIAAPAYLQIVATVPSNVSGILVPQNGFLTSIWSTNEAANTYTLQARRRVGAGFVDITGASLSLVADRVEETSILVAVLKGWEVALQMTAGSGRNIQAGIIFEQDS